MIDTIDKLRILERSYFQLIDRAATRTELDATVESLAEELDRNPPPDNWWAEAMRLVPSADPWDCLWASLLFRAYKHRETLR